MSDRKLSVSFKGGVGYEAPLISIGGDTVEELNHQLDAMLGAGTLERAVNLALKFQGDYIGGKRAAAGEPAQPHPYSQPTSTAPQGSVQYAPAAQQGYQPHPGQGPVPQAPSDWSDVPPSPDPWATTPPPNRGVDPWANQGQQHRSAQQPAQSTHGGPAAYCQCGQQMERKTTTTGKAVLRCPDWRYNGGNATPNHDNIFV